MERTKQKLSTQIKQHSKKLIKEKLKYEGSENVISTGSTLLDLAISGGRFRKGGIPFGILVEIFGPSSCGKTVMLCELAGRVQKQSGNILFHDPEARLNKQFAKLFGLNMEETNYTTPNTIPEVFNQIREWEPDEKKSNAIFTDSLAALSTDLEMENKEGDKMGMKRAKEFSVELRKTCRVLSAKKYLMVCSNQVRQNLDAGPYGQKYISPGGEAIGFYASLRLRCSKPKPIKEKKSIAGKEVSRVIGVETEIEVFKSSVWKPYRRAPLTILYDYGVDDIRQNLQFIKTYTNNKVYMIGEEKLNISLEKAIEEIEKQKLQKELKEEVIELWNEIEDKFKSERNPKQNG